MQSGKHETYNYQDIQLHWFSFMLRKKMKQDILTKLKEN